MLPFTSLSTNFVVSWSLVKTRSPLTYLHTKPFSWRSSFLAAFTLTESDELPSYSHFVCSLGLFNPDSPIAFTLFPPFETRRSVRLADKVSTQPLRTLEKSKSDDAFLNDRMRRYALTYNVRQVLRIPHAIS